ncbi:MAG: hypothetical protein ABSG04_13495 [Verrucomicrobiota bacterium]|jgi:hypothetical protein
MEPAAPPISHSPARAGAAASAAWPESLQRQAMEFALQWVVHRQGSAAELLGGLEEEVGWPARHVLPGALAALRAREDLPDAARKFLHYTLNPGAVSEALAGEVGPNAENQSSLDELFVRSRRYRRSKQFAAAADFMGKFREYSPFNNMLVYLQNPLATYFATASRWHKVFRRTIKDEARGLVILAPRTPVLMVYDIADTEGPALPRKLELFTQATGPFNPLILDRTLKNAERDRILIERKEMGPLRGGFATARAREQGWKMRIGLRQELEPAAVYGVLCHELAHIYLGHLGVDKDGWWPYRLTLPYAVTEIEAEAVAYIVCRRIGLQTRSAEYLSSFVEEDEDLESISLDLVSRAAARIEEMGRRLLAPRRDSGGE